MFLYTKYYINNNKDCLNGQLIKSCAKTMT